MLILPPEYLEELKYILENSLHPERLDSHPWAASPIVQEVNGDSASPGRRLVLAVSRLFAQTMPSTPPKRGKRLDTRWGEFGILAAQYFAPIQFGAPSPASLRDAWGRIDPSILFFVYGKSPDALTHAEKEAYRLVGDEPGVAPSSTLSDWHRKGLLRLAESIQAREKYLEKPAPVISAPESGQAADLKKQRTRRNRKALGLTALFLLILLAGILTVGGFKARRAYELALVLRQDAADIQALRTQAASRLEQVREAGPVLTKLRQDFDALNAEVGPYLWIGPWLDWVPTYGGDLASAQELVTLADALLETADISYQAALPIVEENERARLDLARLTGELVQKASTGLWRPAAVLRRRACPRRCVSLWTMWTSSCPCCRMGYRWAWSCRACWAPAMKAQRPTCCWWRTRMNCVPPEDLSPRPARCSCKTGGWATWNFPTRAMPTTGPNRIPPRPGNCAST
jgi:hypothetical protein